MKALVIEDGYDMYESKRPAIEEKERLMAIEKEKRKVKFKEDIDDATVDFVEFLLKELKNSYGNSTYKYELHSHNIIYKDFFSNREFGDKMKFFLEDSFKKIESFLKDSHYELWWYFDSKFPHNRSKLVCDIYIRCMKREE